MADDAKLIDAILGGDLPKARELMAAEPGAATADLPTAAALGEIDAVERFLAADPASAMAPGGPRSWPPLLYACFSHANRLDGDRSDGLIAVARALLANGADPDSAYVDADGNPDRPLTALYGACGVTNNPAMAEVLLAAGADPDDGESLYHATEHRDHRCLDVLLRHKAVAGNLELHHMLDFQDHGGAGKLLERGRADPNITHIHSGETALHWAVNAGCAAETVALLLDHGATLDAPRNDGRTAYVMACRAGQAESAEVLRGRGAQDDLSEIDRFLYACCKPDEEAARAMIAEFPNLVGNLTEEDRGAIARAAFDGKTQAVALMLDLGFDIAATRGGFTALHSAAGKGDVATTELLIGHGAPLEVLNDYGGTVLHATVFNAAHFQHPDGDYPTVVERLISAGASLEPIPGPYGNDAVDAVLSRHGAF